MNDFKEILNQFKPVDKKVDNLFNDIMPKVLNMKVSNHRELAIKTHNLHAVEHGFEKLADQYSVYNTKHYEEAFHGFDLLFEILKHPNLVASIRSKAKLIALFGSSRPHSYQQKEVLI